MKKIIVLVMAALLVFAFAGCTKTTTDEETSTNEALENASVAEASDLEYIKNKGTLVVGITDYAPMDYKVEGSDEWTGFDAEFARAFAADLGVEIEFIEIDWDNKVFELDAKKIDCIWNGMTITNEISLTTNVSNAYVKNAQVVVMAADKVADYADAASMAELNFAVESGSAGEDAAKENNYTYTAVLTQADALMEVKAGTADACIIDITMANAMTGEGTSYATLAKGIELTSEEYGVSFRKGSDVTAVLNQFMVENKADVLDALATKYELTLAF